MVCKINKSVPGVRQWFQPIFQIFLQIVGKFNHLIWILLWKRLLKSNIFSRILIAGRTAHSLQENVGSAKLGTLQICDWLWRRSWGWCTAEKDTAVREQQQKTKQQNSPHSQPAAYFVAFAGFKKSRIFLTARKKDYSDFFFFFNFGEIFLACGNKTQVKTKFSSTLTWIFLFN